MGHYKFNHVQTALLHQFKKSGQLYNSLFNKLCAIILFKQDMSTVFNYKELPLRNQYYIYTHLISICIYRNSTRVLPLIISLKIKILPAANIFFRHNIFLKIL